MRYILGAVGVIALIILVIILLSSTSPSDTATKNTDKNAIVLTDYVNKNSQVRLTTYGPIVGDEQRKAIRLNISSTVRNFDVLKGYNPVSEKSQTFSNNHAAYETFLHALNNLAYTKTKAVKDQDRIGACPFGNVYIYQIFDDAKEAFSSWSTSCTRKDGTFAGNAGSIRQLFQAQYPNYSDLTLNANIGF